MWEQKKQTRLGSNLLCRLKQASTGMSFLRRFVRKGSGSNLPKRPENNHAQESLLQSEHVYCHRYAHLSDVPYL